MMREGSRNMLGSIGLDVSDFKAQAATAAEIGRWRETHATFSAVMKKVLFSIASLIGAAVVSGVWVVIGRGWQMSTPAVIKLTGLLFVAVLFTILFGVLGYFAGPQIEARGWPIAQARTVADSVSRDDSCVCWTTHFNKWREGTPVLFDYRVTHRGRSIPVAAYKVDHGRRVYLTTYGFAAHAAGSEWDSRYCIDVPRDIARDDSFGLEGSGIYEVWHHLWQVPIPLPSFVVPGSAR